MIKFDAFQKNLISSRLKNIKEESQLFIHDIIAKKYDIDLIKGKRASLGEERDWKGGRWKKEVHGWVRLSDGKVSQEVEEEGIDKDDVKRFAEKSGRTKKTTKGIGIFEGDRHLFASKREEHTQESLTKAVKDILKNKDLTAQHKVLELFKNGLELHEIINVTGNALSRTMIHIKRAVHRGELDIQQDNNSNYQAENKEINEEKENPKEITKLDSDDLKNEINENENSMDMDEVGPDGVKYGSAESRWQSYDDYGMSFASNATKMLFAYGSGGVGKTYNLYEGRESVFNKLKLKRGDLSLKLEEDPDSLAQVDDREGMIYGRNAQTGVPFIDKSKYDYVVIKGKVSPVQMFTLMQEHNGKKIIFDDCNSVLRDEDSVEMLKGALDTGFTTEVTYNTKNKITSKYSNINGAKSIKDKKGNITGYELPETFNFTGGIAFITNLSADKIPQALMTRGAPLDLTMNAQETIEKLETIKDKVPIVSSDGKEMEVAQESRDKAMAFMRKYKDKIHIDRLNARTFGKVTVNHEQARVMGGDYGDRASYNAFVHKPIKRSK